MKRLFLILLLLSIPFICHAGWFFQQDKYHSTTFGATEDPISEGSIWVNGEADGNDWHDIVTGSGYAYGDPSLVTDLYSDPTASLDDKGPWAANQGAYGTVYLPERSDDCWQEFEIRLRQTITADSMIGYEFCYSAKAGADAYLSIARWNGVEEDLTILADYLGADYEVETGDILRAEVIGNTVYAYINDVLKGQVTDDDIVTGSPGLGYDFGCDAGDSDYGFSDFYAYNINHDSVSAGTICNKDTNEIGDRTNRTTEQSTSIGTMWTVLYTPDCNGYLEYPWIKSKDASEYVWVGVFLDDGDSVPDSGDTLLPSGLTGWQWRLIQGTGAAFTRDDQMMAGIYVTTASNYWVSAITYTANTLYYGTWSGKTIYYQTSSGWASSPPTSLPSSGWSTAANSSFAVYVEVH